MPTSWRYVPIWLAAFVCQVGLGLAVPVQMTFGPGNDTEAAWSADGKRIVFQSDRACTLDLYLLDVANKGVRLLVGGPGHSAFPAWSPDGKWIVYCHADLTKTAFEGQTDGYNLFLVAADGGRARRLTRGRSHDYCPTFSPDGKRVWFSSDRGGKLHSNAVSLYSVAVEGGEPTELVPREGSDRAAVAVSFSPGGREVAYGSIAGFRDNWSIRLAQVDRPAEGFPLTEARDSFYSPRFSPTAPVLACTGFRLGDFGWGLYLIDARSGQKLRVETGAGNSRSPAWSPDGRRLVMENNRSGSYKLYCVDAPVLPTEASAPKSAAEAVLHFSFAKRLVATVADLSPRGNAGRIQGSPDWKDGAASFSPAGAFITVTGAKGLDFGAGAFTVRAVVRVPEGCKFAMIAMGEYPDNRLGWQLFVNDDRRACFNSRDKELRYRGSGSDEPLPSGRPVTLIGARDAAGRVRMYVDGAMQRAIAEEALHAYGRPVQVRIGTQYNGTSPFPGWIYEVAVYRGELSMEEVRSDSLRRFWKEAH